MKIDAKFFKRVLVVLMGLALTGVGVGVFLYAQLGVDPFSVLVTGVCSLLNSSYGVASMLLNAAILVIVLVIDRKYVSVASILAIFMIGYPADATSALLGLISIELPLWARVLVALLGCTIISAGIALYTRPEMGVGAGDCFSQLVSDKLKLPYKWVRIVCDAIYLAVGWLLGGSVGVGTVMGVLLTGPIVSFFRPFMQKFSLRITGPLTDKGEAAQD